MMNVDSDHVVVRTVVIGSLPLLVVAVGERGRGPQLLTHLQQRGLSPLHGFYGVQLPRGAQVGFMLAPDELRLVDDRDDTMLRAQRTGLGEQWLEASQRLRGTMTVLVRATAGDAPDPLAQASLEALTAEVDRRARAGDAWGAIVGVAEERPSLPLLF